MKKLITLTTFEYPQESYIIKSKLESEGIYVFLKDELTVQSDNFISNAIGGVKLQVFEQDVEKAKVILQLFDLTTSKPLEPEKFVFVFDRITKKIPFIGKIPLENRGVTLIILTLFLIAVFVNLVTK